MKKIIIILGICFLLACDKNEVPQGEMPQPISTLLAGEWVTISFQSYCGLHDVSPLSNLCNSTMSSTMYLRCLPFTTTTIEHY